MANLFHFSCLPPKVSTGYSPTDVMWCCKMSHVSTKCLIVSHRFVGGLSAFLPYNPPGSMRSLESQESMRGERVCGGESWHWQGATHGSRKLVTEEVAACTKLNQTHTKNFHKNNETGCYLVCFKI